MGRNTPGHFLEFLPDSAEDTPANKNELIYERQWLEPKRDSVEAGSSLPANQLPGTPLSRRAAAMALVLILALVFLAYLNTLWFQFVHDDRFQILGNTWLRSWKY